MSRLMTLILGFLAGISLTEWRWRTKTPAEITVPVQAPIPDLVPPVSEGTTGCAEQSPASDEVDNTGDDTLPAVAEQTEDAQPAATGQDATEKSQEETSPPAPKPSDLAGPEAVAAAIESEEEEIDLEEAKAQLAEKLNESSDEGIVVPYNLGWSPYANNGLRLLGLDRKEVEPLIDGAPYITTSQDYVIYTELAVVHLDLDAKRILAIAALPDEATKPTPTGTVRTRKKPRAGQPNPVKRGVPSTPKEFRDRLEEYGFEITYGKKHPKITHPDLPGVMMPFAATPSETRGYMNAVTDVRRIFGIDVRSWNKNQKPHAQE